MRRIATTGTILALTVSIAGCGAQQSIEHAATSARHAVEEGEKAKKEIEAKKAELEKEAKSLEREGKKARAELERERAKRAGSAAAAHPPPFGRGRYRGCFLSDSPLPALQGVDQGQVAGYQSDENYHEDDCDGHR